MLPAAVFFALFFAICLGLLLLVLQRRRRQRPKARPHRPRASILVAARNEEATIERCLRSLARQNYPAGRLEILIADDHSTDVTAAIIEAFVQDKPPFRLLRVRERLDRAKDKSNALAHLCRAAATDAARFSHTLLGENRRNRPANAVPGPYVAANGPTREPGRVAILRVLPLLHVGGRASVYALARPAGVERAAPYVATAPAAFPLPRAQWPTLRSATDTRPSRHNGRGFRPV